MPSPKSGSPGSLVDPVDADVALDADVADPGVVEAAKAAERAAGTGKYGTQQTEPFSPDEESDSDDSADSSAATSSESSEESSQSVATSWIEIVLVGETGDPIPGEPYAITLPDNTVAEGTLDDKGFARVEGFASGSCKVSFPRLDQDAWEKV